MRLAYGWVVAGVALVVACGSSSSNPAGGGGGSSGNSSSTAGDSSSSGGSGNHQGGSTATGGDGNGQGGEAGDATQLPPVVSMANPHAASGIVAGGVSAKSANFSGVFSLGAAPGGNGVLTSKNTQIRGGVLGASQK